MYITYENIYNYDNLYYAYKLSLKNKNNKRNDIKYFKLNINKNINKLITELKNKTYIPRDYKITTIFDIKPRVIYKPHFRDTIIQRSLYNLIKPLIYKYIIRRNVGCRDEESLITTRNYVQKEFRKYNDEFYYIHLDISKYFYSIDHNILYNKLTKIIKNNDILELCTKFFKTTNDVNNTVGLPLGCIFSQLMGLFYLNDLDQFIKRKLKIKSYIRYVDDFLLIGIDSRDKVNELVSIITDYLDKEYKLKLSKIKINKIKHGINYCGYRIFKNKIILRKRNIKKFIYKLKSNDMNGILAFLEHSKGTSCFNFFIKLLHQYSEKKLIALPRKVVNKYNLGYIDLKRIKLWN